MENEITKIEFQIIAENSLKVSDLKLEIKVNGKTTNAYEYESLNIYKANSDIEGVCELSTTHTKLDKDYIINNNEIYVFEIEELKIENMKYDSSIWQINNTAFVNGKAIEDTGNYCMGSKYEGRTSESFRFILPELTITENEKNETNEIVGQEPNDTNIENNQIYIPAIIGVVSVIVIAIIILICKNNKKNNNI